jgi:hypothetical protein
MSALILINSKIFFSECLRLLHAISVRRFEWKENLALYLGTVNRFIVEKNTPVPRSDGVLESPLNELKRKLELQAVPVPFPIVRGALTEARATNIVQTKDVRKKNPQAAAAACDLMQSKAQLVQSYGPAQESVEERIKEAANFDWLKNCIAKFPQQPFTLQNCLSIKIEEQTWKSREQFTVSLDVALWLYDFANIHFIAQDEIASYQALMTMFNTSFLLSYPTKTIDFYQSLRKKNSLQRPSDFTESNYFYKFELEALKLKQAYRENVSPGITVSNISEMFEDDRKQLFITLGAFLDNIRDMLKEQLTDAVVSDDTWLTHMLSPLYGERVAYRPNPTIQCPINRKHLEQALLILVTKMHSLYELVTQLKEYDAGAPSWTGGDMHPPRYQVLVEAANGILYGYYQLKHPDELKIALTKKTYPALKAEPEFFTSTIKNILELLSGENSIEEAVAALTRSNTSAPPMYRLETFYDDFTRVLSDKVYSRLHKEVNDILNSIGLLAKRYLTQISGI